MLSIEFKQNTLKVKQTVVYHYHALHLWQLTFCQHCRQFQYDLFAVISNWSRGSVYSPVSFCVCYRLAVVGIAQWLECRTHDRKVTGSNRYWSSGRIFFSRVNFLCYSYFGICSTPCVTAVACKRSQSFCQKCRWQVTAKHAYTLRVWLCMKWHGAWLYGVHRTCAKTLQFYVAPAMPVL